jgi:hypothetical protein
MSSQSSQSSQSSRTSADNSDILATTHPLARCQARTISFSATDMDAKTIDDEIEDTKEVSRLSLHTIDSILVEKRRRMRTLLHDAIPDYMTSGNEVIEKDEEDVDIEELGTLALRTANSIDLIRRNTEKIRSTSARSWMGRKWLWFSLRFSQS